MDMYGVDAWEAILPRKLVCTIFISKKAGKWLILRGISYQFNMAKKESQLHTCTQGKLILRSTGKTNLSSRKCDNFIIALEIQASVSSSSKLMLSKTSEILTMSVFKSFNLLFKTSKCKSKDEPDFDIMIKELDFCIT